MNNLTNLTAMAYATQDEEDINEAIRMAGFYLERQLLDYELYTKIVNSLNAIRKDDK